MPRHSQLYALIAVLLVAGACGGSTGSTTGASSTSNPTITTSSTNVTTTAVGSTTTTSTVAALPEYCVVDIAWNDTLNVRTGAGVSFPVIGTLPFYGVGVYHTGNTGTDPNGIWFEINFGGGVGWVASWYLTPAPCGPIVDHDVIVDLTAMTINFDPMEPPPAVQPLACGEGGLCSENHSTTDRATLPLSPSVEVWLLNANVDSVLVTLSQFADYLSNPAGYNPAVYFVPPSSPCQNAPCAKTTVGNPYTLTVQNGEVIRIEQGHMP